MMPPVGVLKHPFGAWPPHRLALIAIMMLAVVGRLSFLGTNPNGLFMDEAAKGYDAYSILRTGRDQYGELLPLFARSFNDYNESIYRFLAVPFVLAFGLNECSIRLPAALAGILTVPAVYFLARELYGRNVGVLSALLLAISPWHFQFSRIAFRAILLPLCLCWGLFHFLKGTRYPRHWLMAAVAFSLSLYTYSSARVFVPLFLVFLVTIYRRELWRAKVYASLSAAVVLVVLIALALFWVSPHGMAHANRAISGGVGQWLRNYLGYYSPSFLFVQGDHNLRHCLLHSGQLHYFEWLTLPVGLIAIGSRWRHKESWLVLVWLALYPIPAALTAPHHALRAIVGAPVFCLVSAVGLEALGQRFAGRWRGFLALMLAAGIGVCATWHGKRYFVDYPRYSAGAWQYGMREAFQWAEQAGNRRVIVSDRLPRPIHIFLLFYTQLPPSPTLHALLLQVARDNGRYRDFVLDRYVVTRIAALPPEDYRGSLLLVAPDEEVAVRQRTATHVGHRVQDPMGQPVAVILEAAPTLQERTPVAPQADARSPRYSASRTPGTSPADGEISSQYR